MTGRVPLSARLEAIADLAGRGKTVCDVGCDHAHIPIRLLQTGCFENAIGMDVIEGPLGKAAGNLALYGMEDRVALRLSDGLDAFRAGEADTLVITGMGGTMMENILLREPEKTRSFMALVLGPQSDPDKVRAALRQLKFAIVDERLIYDDGKYYPVLRAEKDRDVPGTCDPSEKSPSRISPQGRSPSGIVVRVKNNPDGLFFTPEVCAAERPKPPVILHRFRLRENGEGSRSASGIVVRVNNARDQSRSSGKSIPENDLIREAGDLFGPILLQRRDPVLYEFLTRQTAVLEKIRISIAGALRQRAAETGSAGGRQQTGADLSGSAGSRQQAGGDPSAIADGNPDAVELADRHLARLREIEHSLQVFRAGLTFFEDGLIDR